MVARDQFLVNDSKRKLYIESVRQRATELSLLDVNTNDKQKIDRQFSLQEDLLDRLEEKCGDVLEELPVEEGAPRLVIKEINK